MILSLRKQCGAGIAEFIIMWPILVLVVLGSIQIGFMYRAKSTFNQATFAAAREGALNNALIAPMRTALADALAPLYLRNGPNLANYGTAVLQSRRDNSFLPPGAGGVRINIISPTEAVFDRFAVDHRPLIPCSGRSCPHGGRFQRGGDSDIVRQIPNDNLNYRSAAIVRVGSGATEQNINIQDANLLKIEAHMCYELDIPLVDNIIFVALNNIFSPSFQLLNRNSPPGGDLGARGDHWAACRARGVAESLLSPRNRFFIPLTSSSVVRMQSPVWCEGDLRRGRNCSNLN